MQKLHTGDTVIVIAGKDKGKVGKILRFTTPSRKKSGRIPNPHRRLVVVQGVNVVTKSVKGEGFTQLEKPIDISNVMYYDVENEVASKVVIEKKDKGRQRVLKANGKVIK